MKMRLLLALMLASGMAFAQSSGSSPGSTDQQPSTQQPSSQSPADQTQANPSQSPSTGQSPASAGQGSMTGCLKGSGGGWVLITEQQSAPVPLTGDSSMLSPHNGHQVQVKGTQASDGSVQVTDITMISDTCTTKPPSDSSGGMGAAAGAATGAVTGAATSAADTTKSAASEAGSAVQNAPSSASTAAGEVASGAKSAAGDVTQTAQTTTQPSGSAQATPSPGGAGAAQAPSPSGAGPAGAGAEATPPPSPQAGKAAKGGKLPQTASPLPLLGLMGLGSLLTGLIARRK